MTDSGRTEKVLKMPLNPLDQTQVELAATKIILMEMLRTLNGSGQHPGLLHTIRDALSKSAEAWRVHDADASQERELRDAIRAAGYNMLGQIERA